MVKGLIFIDNVNEIEAIEQNSIENIIVIAMRPSVCICLLYTSPSPRDRTRSRMPSSA